MTLSRDHVTSCSALASAMASISVAVIGSTPPVMDVESPDRLTPVRRLVTTQ